MPDSRSEKIQENSMLNRRAFLGAAVGAGAILGAPAVWAAPKSQDVERKRQPPSDRLNVAVCGVGGRGSQDLDAFKDENIVALCDVDEQKAAKSFKKYPSAKRYADFRLMLEKENRNIDAVVVATPDHMHAPIALMAMKMGKHVYVEKPLAHSIHETRLLRQTAREMGVVSQMGIQGHAKEGARLLCEWIWAGAIGAVREVRYWTNRPIWPQGIDRPAESEAVPPTLNWDLWLGVAPARPYHSCYAPFKWRGWWDFGSGAMGDMGCHFMDAGFWALKLGAPSSVIAESDPINAETYPKSSRIVFEFPARDDLPPVKILWQDGVQQPPKIEGLEADREINIKNGVQLFVGDKGTIMADQYCDSPRLIPEEKMKEFLPNRPEKSLPRSPGIHQEFIAACKGEGSTGANFDYAAPLTEIALLGNIALRTGQRIEFDSDSMSVKGLPEAEKLIHPAWRPGYEA